MNHIIKNVITSRVYEVAIHSDLDYAHSLSQQLNNAVYLKREDLQPVFSFKLRGAYNKMAFLTEAEKQKGVICSSAGNHAQGVALGAQKLGMDALIVMPKTTPLIKIKAVERRGGVVILEGDDYTEAAFHCQKVIEETKRTYIHPYDDPLVIAGQGTVGFEILQQLPSTDIIFVPIGGGGLISGIAAFLKAVAPQIKIVGVEPEDSNAMKLSMDQGKRITLDRVGIFADGVAVKTVGELTFKLVQKYVDEIITVSTDEICSAIKSIYEDTRSIVEPAGALGVAGLRKYAQLNKLKGHKLVAINSGANMNFDRLQFVAERTHTGENSEVLLAVTIPEKPGALKAFCENVVQSHNITEFNYRLSARDKAHVFVGVSIIKPKERDLLFDLLSQHGYEWVDLTDNELAKTHIRHMVGGQSQVTQNEVLYSFQFPEKPQALSYFLNAMSTSWNISLFHYRMHGGDFGRVLIGIELPSSDQSAFKAFLDKLQYQFKEETSNPVYQIFL